MESTQTISDLTISNVFNANITTLCIIDRCSIMGWFYFLIKKKKVKHFPSKLSLWVTQWVRSSNVFPFTEFALSQSTKAHGPTTTYVVDLVLRINRNEEQNYFSSPIRKSKCWAENNCGNSHSYPASVFLTHVCLQSWRPDGLFPNWLCFLHHSNLFLL